MRILLSAYACEPHKGSEPGIGWHWVVTLNKIGHKVTVITRSNNKSAIEKAIIEHSELNSIIFLYYDVPKLFLKAKKIIGTNLYYELWQLGLIRFVKNTLNPEDYDVVHHLTFGVFRQPSYLYKFKHPFIIGPLGGGEKIPTKLRASLPFKYRLKENIRDIANSVSLHRTSLLNCFKNADLIFARTKETLSILPDNAKNKTKVLIDIGVNKKDISENSKKFPVNKSVNVLYVGRLIYWKGIALAIYSFKDYNVKYPTSSFTIVGSGEYYPELKKLVIDLGLDEKIKFTGAIPHKEIELVYAKADIFLFPTLHDAGPLVTLEALRVGLPVVSLNIGGLGQLLTPSYPAIVTSDDYCFDKTVKQISEMLFKLSTNEEFYLNTSRKSILIAEENTWEQTVQNVYNTISEKIVFKN